MKKWTTEEEEVLILEVSIFGYYEGIRMHCKGYDRSYDSVRSKYRKIKNEDPVTPVEIKKVFTPTVQDTPEVKEEPVTVENKPKQTLLGRLKNIFKKKKE